MPTARPKPVRRKLKLDFSVTGFLYCTMMMFIGIAAMNTQANLLFGVFGLMVGILIVSFLLSGVVLKRLKVQRVLPDHLIVGRPGTICYEVTNRKRFWPSLAVTVSEVESADAFVRPPSAYMLHAANRMTATIVTEVLPKRRGVVKLDRYQLSTSFPFGFIKRAVDRREPASLLVLPAIGSMRRDLLTRFRSARSSGVKVRPSSGGDDEFYGVREYRHGENPRRIYWKRSAGAGPMVVREMTRVTPPKVIVVIDSRQRDDTPQSLAAVEKAVAVAATLIDACMDSGLPVGLAAWTGEWCKLQPELGKRHRLDLLAALAKLPPNDHVTAYELIDHARDLIKGESTAVLVTPYDSAAGSLDGPRGGIVVVSAADDSHFTFPPEVDFGLGFAG